MGYSISGSHLPGSREPRAQCFMGKANYAGPLIRVLPPDTLKSTTDLESSEGSDEMTDRFSEEEELVNNFNFPSNHISYFCSISS
jgi:hypothetical protein